MFKWQNKDYFFFGAINKATGKEKNKTFLGNTMFLWQFLKPVQPVLWC